MKLDLGREIQQQIKQGVHLPFVILAIPSCSKKSVQCNVVTFFSSVKENECFSKR
jgi:hypothetical protein